MIKLQSKDHKEILNMIDKLRSEGISKYVDLCQGVARSLGQKTKKTRVNPTHRIHEPQP